MERSLATGCAYWPSALSAAVPRGPGRSRRPGSPDPPLHVPLPRQEGNERPRCRNGWQRPALCRACLRVSALHDRMHEACGME